MQKDEMMQMQTLPTRPSTLTRQQGFTLIELLVVVVILGLLGSVGGVIVIKYLENAKIDLAKTKCTEIEQSFESFEVQQGNLPSVDEAIDSLIEKGYLKKDKIYDPWDEKVFVREVDGGVYKVFSKGKDKQEGTEDDIGSNGLLSEGGGDEDF